MPDDEETPDDEQPERSESHWYTDPRKLVPFLGALVALIIGVMQIGARLDDPPPSVSAEYIVDVSRGMRGTIGPTPKLPAVAAEVVSNVKRTPSVSTALRLSGPACSAAHRDADVPFDEDNADRFNEALEQARSRGESNFANAFAHAISDFIDRSDAAASKAKNLYIFVGGRDTCTSRPIEVVTQALRDLRVNKDVQLNLKFVGVKVPPEVRAILRALRREADSLGYRADVVVANRPGELERVLPGRSCTPGDIEYGRRC